MSFGVPVIAIGDPGQLPPVKDTWFFPMNEPDFLLTEIHRQARDNPVIRLAHDIRNGMRLRPCTMGDQVVITHRGRIEMSECPEDMPQVIVGKNATRWRYNDRIRGHLGYRGLLPNPGEKLLVKKNSQNIPGMINGAEAVSVSMKPTDYFEHSIEATINLDGEDVDCVVWDGPFRETRFGERAKTRRKSSDWISSVDNERVDFGHAITCHSAQGSQWPYVVVLDESETFKTDAQRFLYTAVTRTSNKLVVLI
ncbi:MAG: ATP-binding domain-containing protein, partial [Geminicoccaceae bacterium]